MPLTLTLPDGRTVAYAEYGDPGGRPVVVLHGSPGSRLQVAPLDGAARAAGVRVVAPDRAGFGASDPHPRLGFVDYARDVAALVDGLGLGRVTVAGLSGGGGYALACAASMPERCSAVLLLCAMVPRPPAEAVAGMSRSNRIAFWLARRAPWLLRPLLARRLRASADPDVEAALGQGLDPLVAELALYGAPLPVDLSSLTVQVELVHGTADVSVPVGVARWVARSIPGATLTELPGEGHLFLLDHPEQLFDRVR